MERGDVNDNVSRVQTRRVSNLNAANALTVARIVLVPVFICLALRPSYLERLLAFVVFAIAAITDKLDGHLARSRGLITDFGRIVDPIADKALTLSAFALLSWQALLPWWVTIVIAVRELGITWLRAAFLRRGIVVAAAYSGKVKTLLQILALGTLLIPWDYLPVLDPAYTWLAEALISLGLVLTGAALAVTVYSGIMYVVDGIRISKELDAQADGADPAHGDGEGACDEGDGPSEQDEGGPSQQDAAHGAAPQN